MIGMAVGDQGPRDGARRVNMRIADRRVEPGWAGAEQIFWTHRTDIMTETGLGKPAGYAALGRASSARILYSAVVSLVLRSRSATPGTRRILAIRASAFR